MEIDSRKIDVNVHPTKLEIRFEEEQKVFKAIYHSIRDSLLRGDLVKNVEKDDEVEYVKQDELSLDKSGIEDGEDKATQDVEVAKEAYKNIKEDMHNTKIPSFINLFKKKEKIPDEEFIKSNDENTIEKLYEARNVSKEESSDNTEKITVPTEEQIDNINNILNLQKTMEIEIGNTNENTLKNFDEMYIKTFGKLPNSNEEVVEDLKMTDYELKDNLSVFEGQEEYEKVPLYKYIGSIFSTYIVIEIQDEIYIIDQHAAHERIMYEKVKQNFCDNKEKDSQIMLLPDVITLSHKEKDVIKENEDIFEKAGFIYEDFGDNTIKLIGVPSMCIDLDTKQLFIELLDEIDTVAITAKQEKEEKFIATIACKAAVKANMNLSKEEIDELMKNLLKLPNPFTCPHGRPTAIRMSKSDIEKKFNRR